MSAIFANPVRRELRVLRETVAVEIAHDTALWADGLPACIRDDSIALVYAMRERVQAQLRRAVLYGEVCD